VEKKFQDLKMAFTTALVLVHFDLAKAFDLKIDASYFALEVVLLQIGEKEKLDSIAFYFQ